MDTKLLEWITKNIFVPEVEGSNKTRFLTWLRDEPDRIASYVNSNMHGWLVGSAHDLGSTFCNDITGSGDKVVAHLLIFFAKEIASLPQPAAAS